MNKSINKSIKKFFKKHPKFKNPYFYLSILALIFASAGIDASSLTNWKLLTESLSDILGNPFILFCEIVAIVGVFNDNSTPGIDGLEKFKIKEKKDE